MIPEIALRRIGPGVFTTKPFIHEYWEEVYVISGDLIVGNDEKGENGARNWWLEHGDLTCRRSPVTR